MLQSINQLSDLTGRHRHTITKRLLDLPFVDGEKGAHLYESTEALPLIYAVDNLEAARAKQALSQAALNAVREEVLRKERIPIQIVLDEMDAVFQAMGATLKAAKGKTLTRELINDIFDKFRSVPAKLKWRCGDRRIWIQAGKSNALFLLTRLFVIWDFPTTGSKHYPYTPLFLRAK